MLTNKQLVEIREHLEKAQNPVFFFDDDADGLCSYLILNRFIGRGPGIAIKSYPDLAESYLRRVDELNADYVFVLDKPNINKTFLDGLKDRNIPVVVIDHHESDLTSEDCYLFNSFPSSEPVTYIAYQISQKKEDMWIAMVGCISDVYKPDFGKEFAKMYPELYSAEYDAFTAKYKTEIGKFGIMLNFGLKDTITNVVKLTKYLAKSKGPFDILEENSITRDFHRKYNELNNKYMDIVEKVGSVGKTGQFIFVEYSASSGLSAEISNKLVFDNPEKLIFVARKTDEGVSISVRGKGAKKVTLELVDKIEGAVGGGHEQACGMKVPLDKLDELKGLVGEVLEKNL
jgi:single-stranded DNA-specific DHH superfamily exonuclease